MDHLKHDKPLYSKCGFTIQRISEENDRFEIFDDLVKTKIGDSVMHPLKRLELRRILKTKTQFLYKNKNSVTYVIRKNDEYVGFVLLLKLDDGKIPNVDHIYIRKKFRKTKAVACIIDFGMNYLFPKTNIKIESQMVPGFRKICIDGGKLIGTHFVVQETAKRVARICNNCKDK